MNTKKYLDLFSKGKNESNIPVVSKFHSEDLTIAEAFFESEYETFVTECTINCCVPERATVYVIWDIIRKSSWYKTWINNCTPIFAEDLDKISNSVLYDGAKEYPIFVELFRKYEFDKKFDWLAICFWNVVDIDSILSSDLVEEIRDCQNVESAIQDSVIESNDKRWKSIKSELNECAIFMPTNKEFSVFHDIKQDLDTFMYRNRKSFNFGYLVAENILETLENVYGISMPNIDSCLYDTDSQLNYSDILELPYKHYKKCDKNDVLDALKSSNAIPSRKSITNVFVVSALIRVMFYVLNPHTSDNFEEYIELQTI